MSGIRRREFVILLGSSAAAAWPLAARAQQGERMRRVGVLVNLAADDPIGQARVAAFVRGLQAAGWVEGRNLRIDIRWAGSEAGNYPRYAAELLALEPDVVLAVTTSSALPLLRSSRTLPIVFVGIVDPVGSGLVKSMARPGGNASGFVTFEYALAAKWLELLKEIAPHATRAAVLRDPAIAAGIGQFAAIQTVAPVGLELSAVDARDAGEIESAVAEFAQRPNGGLVATAGPFVANHPDLIAALAARFRLPGISAFNWTR